MAKRRILIIDDEPGFTHLLKLNLEKMDSYEVREVNSGELGLTVAKEFKPDLILLDIVMPDLDGSSVASQIRADKEMRDVPILFLTAVLTKQESKEMGGMIAGYPCLAKPVSPEEVAASIEKYLGKQNGGKTE